MAIYATLSQVVVCVLKLPSQPATGTITSPKKATIGPAITCTRALRRERCTRGWDARAWLQSTHEVFTRGVYNGELDL